MTIYDFKALSTDAQAKLVWEEGVLLMSREEAGIKYILYQYEGIYAEFHYHTTDNKLVQLKSFINPDLLDPYFEQ